MDSLPVTASLSYDFGLPATAQIRSTLTEMLPTDSADKTHKLSRFLPNPGVSLCALDHAHSIVHVFLETPSANHDSGLEFSVLVIVVETFRIVCDDAVHPILEAPRHPLVRIVGPGKYQPVGDGRNTDDMQYRTSLLQVWAGVEQSLVITLSCVPSLRTWFNNMVLPAFQSMTSSVLRDFNSSLRSRSGPRD
ncbi:uncharacterized protein PG986_000469 [Apiospora aurea]|uniref:Uncharacterized protein n=1 Tax=Apiospora aurea TaxID=335848 RepID=A0ABR1QU65_9PEZI